MADVHRSEAETLDRRSGRSRRSLSAGRAKRSRNLQEVRSEESILKSPQRASGSQTEQRTNGDRWQQNWRRRSSLSDLDISGGFENFRWLAISHLEADLYQLESAVCGASLPVRTRRPSLGDLHPSTDAPRFRARRAARRHKNLRGLQLRARQCR